MPDSPVSGPVQRSRVPPRWFVTTAWKVHRALFRVTPGSVGLRRPKPGRWGMLRLTTVGRRSGRERSVILAYLEDGSDLVTMAMNGWGEGEPAWWLNLQATPDAIVEVRSGTRRMTARRAEGAEHERLWARWCALEDGLDGLAALRSTPTRLVILSPGGVSTNG